MSLKNKFTAEIASVLNHIILSVEQGNQKAIQALSEVLPIRHPSQIYQALLEGLIPFLIVCFLWIKIPKKPGVIAGVWGVCYLIMRIVGEQFRMPDDYIGFDFLGLTRGQWLSVILLVPVLVYCYFVLYKNRSAKHFK